MENEAVICITTRNRPEDLERCLYAWDKFYPEIPIIIVDDASDIVYCKSDYRFTKQAGISRAKNKCIELSMLKDVDHIILADDDAIPIKRGGLEKYIESKYNHLCYTFLPNGNKLDDNHTKHTLGNGCLMYFNRVVFETIGGFDTTFFAKYEHTQLSHRCYYNGLIPMPYIDIKNSMEYFHCFDQDEGHKRSFSELEMRDLLRSGSKHFIKTLNSKEFFSYI